MSKTRESSSPTMPKPQVANHQPTQEEIALRAYHIYTERGGVPGNEFEDWMEAQRQLTAQYAKGTENGKAAENGKPRRKPTVKTAAA